MFCLYLDTTRLPPFVLHVVILKIRFAMGNAPTSSVNITSLIAKRMYTN